MIRDTSVAMTRAVEAVLLRQLVRGDGQEDICLATYRPSTGLTRFSALIRLVVPPERGDRLVHGNATITADYILRAAEVAQKDHCGLVMLHSHPGATGWQAMSGLDRECESSFANLVREFTGLPLVGMTLATRTATWSARHWDRGVGRDVDCTHSVNVRVIGDRLAVSWNDGLRQPLAPSLSQSRTVSAWGNHCQSDLVRRRILVVGAGSVGLDVVLRLAASGISRLTVMDFDFVEDHNLDRLIGAARRDAYLRRPKIHVARREAVRAATGSRFNIDASSLSICEPEGLRLALDHDLVFSCVDRPWPRAVLNSLAYSDLIPVIDGGLAVDTFEGGEMRNATWRSHVVRPARPCMSCNRQLDLALVSLERQGLLDDPDYIATSERSHSRVNPNVAPLSISVAASVLAQYVSFSVAPAGFGDPGPLQYSLNTHILEQRADVASPHCPIESAESTGDHRSQLTGVHQNAESMRNLTGSIGARRHALRWLDDRLLALVERINRHRG